MSNDIQTLQIISNFKFCLETSNGVGETHITISCSLRARPEPWHPLSQLKAPSLDKHCPILHSRVKQRYKTKKLKSDVKKLFYPRIEA